ncbi:hypothetical protein ACFSUK_33675 [Sphingobium scionense]
MAAGALIAPGSPNGPRGRRKTSPITFGRVLVVVGVGLALVIGYNFLGKQTVSDRPNEMRTTQVILPPPPPLRRRPNRSRSSSRRSRPSRRRSSSRSIRRRRPTPAMIQRPATMR